ncbi:putative sodium-coupled neutral amino acid transporter 7 [Aplysia californica]|uniref:Sodium-coupled neutral amino acid transporter 7 n=1 Tax=Aplysia californica TaxID=6500 RepID=A0ABM0JCI5_APLCA|nr:putative sodium-coupled neutral amino acid transporter 7 [Aplysia californica]
MSIQVTSDVHRRSVSPSQEYDHEYDSEIKDDELRPILGSGSVTVSVAEVRVQTGSGWFSSAFLVVNAALGAGLLNFPIAYHQAGGVLIAIIIQSVFLVFVVMAIMILGYCSDIKKTNTYQDVVHSVCGPMAQLACAVSITLYCFGTCITFLIIIGDQWELFFIDVARSFYCGSNPFYMSRAFTISVSSVLLILPLCFPRKIDFLKYASVVGVIGILYVVALVTTKYFLPHTEPSSIATSPKSWIDVFLVVPDICFAYQCHVSIIPIYSCMEKRNLREFSKTISLAMVLCVLTYTVTAALGYLQFGDKITSDVLLSFDPDIPVIFAVVLIAIKTYTTYPILLFCGRAGFDCIWSRIWKITPEEFLLKERRRRIITTILWFIATLLLSIFIPNIGVVIQILGAFAAIFIFIFPGMCLLKTMQDRIETGEPQPRLVHFMKGFSIVFIVLGAFIFGLTLSQAVMKDMQGVHADKSNFTCSSN